MISISTGSIGRRLFCLPLRFETYTKKENSRPEPATMDKRRYSPPDQEKRVHSKEIESQSHPTSAGKYRKMCSEVKRLLRESRENFFSSINDSFANNPKRFWSVMKQKSKTCTIPDCISMPAPSSSTDQVDPSSARPTATKPAEIAEMFNAYFASVFTSDDLSDPSEESNADHHMTELILSELEVEVTLKSLDNNKATGPDEIPARLLKATAPVIICSLSL